MAAPGPASLPKVTPQVICGALVPQNKTALEWSWQGPVAYGCHNHVVVIDPRTAQALQTLVGHKASVIKVRWARQLYHCTLGSPYMLRLASVDAVGMCIVWDVGQATAMATFSLGNKHLVDIQWLTTNDSCRDLLAVLVAPSTMTIWNADTATKVSRFTFSEAITAFSFSPFRPENLVLLSSDCFIFVSDFSPVRQPVGGGKKMYMSVPQQSSVRVPSRGGRERRVLSGESQRTENSLSLAECCQLLHSPANSHHLILLFPREILIIDTEIKQAVGSVFLERNTSPFVQIAHCQQRDAFYCLHENGCISFRVRQLLELPKNVPLTLQDFMQPRDVSYDLHAHSEPLRISKSIYPFAMSLCPTTELQVALLISDGRALIWTVEFDKVGVYRERLDDELMNKDGRPPLTLISALPRRVSPLVSFGEEEEKEVGEPGEPLTLQDSIAPHWFVPPDDGGPSHTYSQLLVNMVLTAVHYSLAPNLTTLRMCPPLTTRNWAQYKPLVAIGNSAGGIQVYNLATRQLYKDIATHTCPVRGMEWIGLKKIISYGFPSLNNSGMARNEIAITHLDTGYVQMLRKPDAGYQHPISSVRVSPHKNYFVINYKDSAPDFWDANKFVFMRKLDSKPCLFVAIEWAASVAFPSLHSKARSVPTTHLDIPSENAAGDPYSNQFNHKNKQQVEEKVNLPEKEVITLMDTSANIHHLLVELNGFEIGPAKSIQTQLNHPTCLAWKGEILAAGDLDGVVMIWDLLSSNLKYMDATRGAIRKMRFGPGKGNKRLVMLYATRLDIREIYEDTLIGQIRWGKDDLSVEDVDWCTSDKPICIMSDGTVRVFDIKLQCCTSIPSPTDYTVPVFSPHTMLPQITFRLKTILQHQPWNHEYSLSYDDLDKLDPLEKGLSTLLETLPNDFHTHLVETKLGAPQRCLFTALLFGDEQEYHFWTIALYHMLRERERKRGRTYRVYQEATPREPSTDIIQPNLQASISITSSLQGSLEDLLEASDGWGEESLKDLGVHLQEANQRTWRLTPPLDFCHELYIDKEVFQHFQLYQALRQDSHRHTSPQTRRCAETLLLLGQTDRAVQLLLETDSTSSDYYTDALRACLAATIRSSGVSQSTIKLVATNLIANAKLSEGMQLLCLIDKGVDACRYLQTYGEWNQSVWLARSTLTEPQEKEVLIRWTEHLASSSVNQKSKAIYVLLSIGYFTKVIETLYSMRNFDQAALFTESCLEYGLIRKNKKTAPLMEAVFLEYARCLESQGLLRAMRYYCNLAGDKGTQLLADHLTPKKSPAPQTSNY